MSKYVNEVLDGPRLYDVKTEDGLTTLFSKVQIDKNYTPLVEGSNFGAKDANHFDNMITALSIDNTKIRLELELAKLDGVGFYDIFNTLDDVNESLTNADVDTVAMDVTFDVEAYNITASNDYTAQTTIRTNEEPSVGDRIDDVNEILTISPISDEVVYDKTNIEQVINVSGDTSYNNGDKIVSDSEGNLYEVYSYTDGTHPQIWCRKWTKETNSWSDMSFPQISGYSQYKPSIAIDSNDNLYVIWHGTDSTNTTNYQIKYSKFTTSWSAWVNIQETNGYYHKNASIAVDSNDDLHVIWEGTDSSNTSDSQIKYSKFTTSWSAWVNISRVAGYDQNNANIKIDSSDDLHVVWNGEDVGNTTFDQIKYSKFTTSWSAWVNISVVSSYDQLYPSIAIDSNDNLHVAWMGKDSVNTTYQIKYSKLTTSWSSWVNIQEINGYEEQFPSIAIDYNNDIHVVFSGTDSINPTHRQIKYSKFTTSWSAWVNITTGKTAIQNSPSICKTIINFDKPIVIWQDAQLNQVSIYGKWTVSGTVYELGLESPVTILADDLLEVFPSAYPYETLTMVERTFKINVETVTTVLYLSSGSSIDFEVYVNGVLATLLYDEELELTYRIENVDSKNVILKVNGKSSAVLDNLLFAIS